MLTRRETAARDMVREGEEVLITIATIPTAPEAPWRATAGRSKGRIDGEALWRTIHAVRLIAPGPRLAEGPEGPPGHRRGTADGDRRPSRDRREGRAMIDWRHHVTSHLQICHGQLCAKGTRVLVTNILDSLAEGARREEILRSYPSPRPEHIDAALASAAAE